MAIDSAEKRKSLSGIQITLIAGVANNASKDQEWRQEAGWGYGGILVSGPPEALVGNRRTFTLDDARRILTLDDARRTFTLDDQRRTFKTN